MIFVSGCLWGKNCKYSGGNNLRENLKEKLKGEEIMLICPECLGELPTPRSPSEIEEGFDGENVICGMGKVFSRDGKDVTAEFLKGAEKVLELAKKHNPKAVYLKQGSPSCGFGLIYDGTFTGVKKAGNGITAQLLIDNGFHVIAEE
ncbi:MAG: DUF523 domain-containing protein [Bacillota bacterium]|nr:DUF523 domain-containing protein [Bacillota bacterium]